MLPTIKDGDKRIVNKRHSYILLALFSLCLFCVGCIPKPLTINGSSMAPTLNNGDVIFVRVTTDEIKRGEIVLMQHPTESYSMVARVIGLPNESILISSNKVYINNQLLDELYIQPENNLLKLKEGSFKVNDQSYFVLGDNRDNSLDSRYFGAIKEENILGRYYTTVKKAEK